MRVDLEELAGVPAEPFRSRICVVGAGIAGLVLARRLGEMGFSVALLEAGGLELEERSQALYAAEFPYEEHTGSTMGRFRTFGGSSTRWGGQLLPFTEDVFAPPAGVPSVSWPIGPAELERFYPEVERVMGVDALPFSAELLPAVGRPAVAMPAELRLRFSKWAPFARRNLAGTVGAEVLASDRLTVYTHANAEELLPGDGGRVRGVRAVDYRGRTFVFEAEAIVVATGTVESSRLLLLSREAVPDPQEQLGRYFHDHVSLRAAELQGEARQVYLDRLGPAFVQGTLHTAKVEAGADLRAREGLLATMAHLVIEEPEDSGAAAVRNLLRSVQQGRLGEAVGRNLLPMVRGSADVARLVWASKVRRRRAVSARARVWLHVDLEQPAEPTTRVHLSEARDALGMRKAAVAWRTGALEAGTARRFARALGGLLRGAGLPEPAWLPEVLGGDGALPFTDTYHPMGGLRMGTDPARSVVDGDLRVHTAANVFVASCAVYPSGGSSNPTFTLMALALRLAERLRSELS